MSNKQFQGLISLVLAALFYGLYGVLSRIISMDFGAVFQVVARDTIVLGILTLYILKLKKWKKVIKSDYKWFFLMTFPGIVSIVAIFIAFNNLALGTAMFAFYAASTLASYLLGFTLFKEKLTWKKITSLFTSFIGLYLMFFSLFSAGKIIFLILACVSGIGSAGWNVISKKVSKKYAITQVRLIDSSLTILIGLPLALLLKEPSLPALTEPWLGVFLYAVVAVLSSLLLINGFRHLQAQVGSLILLLEPVFAAFFGWLFYKEVLTIYSLVGGLLILFGAALPNIKVRTTRNEN